MEDDRGLIGDGINLGVGLFECFISGRWQWKWYPCDPIIEDSVAHPPVTCNFTVDNEVLEVYYNNKSLVPTGHLNMWQDEKTVTFVPEDDGYGEIKLKGVDHGFLGQPGIDDHCTWGGLVMLCKSSNGKGPWHDFKSDIRYWRSEDQYELCESDGGIVSDFLLAMANDNFLRPLVEAGANKIWTSHKENTLIGSPMQCKLHF